VLIDSHAHLDSTRYDDDRLAVLQRAAAAGVDTILSIGIGEGPDTMHRAAEIASEFAGLPDVPRIFASAGIHPSETTFADQAALDKLADLTRHPHIIAVGEIGLDDYHADNPPQDVQHRAFIQQMEIARAAKLPILIHCRAKEGTTTAWDDTLSLLETHWRDTGLGGVLHCFGGEWQHAQRGIDMGFYISFAGNVTFPKAQPLRDVAARVPADSLLIETDCPFLAPIPHRGKRNEPAFVAQVPQTLADARNTTPEEIAVSTTNNFLRLFQAAQHPLQHCPFR
jgi:TatD DNase family protein